MPVRIRFTLLYSSILLLIMFFVDIVFYNIQSQSMMEYIKHDLKMGNLMMEQIGVVYGEIYDKLPEKPKDFPPLTPPKIIDTDQLLRENRVIRVFSGKGNLIVSSLTNDHTSLSVSKAGRKALEQGLEWSEITSNSSDRFLEYYTPILFNGSLFGVFQSSRSLKEYDHSLATVRDSLTILNLAIFFSSFLIGWVFSGLVLQPVHRLTTTIKEIGNTKDLTRRVDYRGPADEFSELTGTINHMLERVQQAYDQVSLSLRQQMNFVSDVSHELRTPLTTIRGNLAMLQWNPPLPEEEKNEAVVEMVEENERLIGLVQRLLILARTEAGQRLMKEPVVVHSVVENACRQARLLSSSCQIQEEYLQDVHALGDMVALKQVLLSLLDNAIKYSDGKIRVVTDIKDDQALILVSDSGPGMSEEMLQHIFDRYYRGNVDHKVDGFGLGLSIAKVLMEEQGGGIEIKSSPQTGTRIYLTLPLLSE